MRSLAVSIGYSCYPRCSERCWYGTSCERCKLSLFPRERIDPLTTHRENITLRPNSEWVRAAIRIGRVRRGSRLSVANYPPPHLDGRERFVQPLDAIDVASFSEKRDFRKF